MENTLKYIEQTEVSEKEAIVSVLRKDILHLMNYIREHSELPTNLWDELDAVSESVREEFTIVDDILDMLNNTDTIISAVNDMSDEEYGMLYKSLETNTSYLDFTYDRLIAHTNMGEHLDDKYEGILISPELLMYEMIEDRTDCYKLAEDMAQIRAVPKAKQLLGEDIYRVLGAVEIILKTRLGLDHTLDYTSKEILSVVQESKGNIDTFDPYILVYGNKY